MTRLLSLLTVLLVIGAGAFAALRATGAPPPSRDPAPAPADGTRVAAVSALAKLRPGDALPKDAASEVRLRALRGECEHAQLAVAAGSTGVEAVSVRLAGTLGAGVEARLHRIELVRLTLPSGPEGGTGLWPDPLVPVVDAYEGEPRKAFPFPVPAGELRSVLVELCVSREAAPGLRKAGLAVSLDGEEKQVPLELSVEPDEIPATSSVPNTFGFSALRAAMGHFGRPGTPEELSRLDRLYRTALLRHRISVHGGTMEPPPFTRGPKGISVDFSAYDREVAPFLEGRALPSGARATTAELRTHPKLQSDEERVAYWQAFARHHREKGWKALLFDYARDEPKREDLPSVVQRAKLVRRADPGIRVLLTASWDPSLHGLIDLWTPNLNCLFVKSRPEEFCHWRAPRESYTKGGSTLWWYQSCSSHGCNEEPAKLDYFRGWPSYMIDAPGTRSRAMGWLAFAEGIGGELYWDTVYAYAPEGKPVDPWEGTPLRAFGGNGDGTFFYPGTPARIGGGKHVPAESLRLKLVRDSFEDWELLRLVASRPGGEKVARAAAARLAPTAFRVTDDPRVLEQAREGLLDWLRGGGSKSRRE